MRILESASCIAVIVSLFIAADLATTIYDDNGILALEMRNRRAVSSNLSYNGCGHWTDWISRNKPTNSSPNENEHLSNEDLNVLCPSTGGNTVKDFRCRDEKGEPIHDIINKTDVSNAYVYTCSNMYATCFRFNASKDKCPDYAIQVMCACKQTTPTSGTTITSDTGGGSVTRSGTSGSGTGGESVTGSGSVGSSTGGGSVTTRGSSGNGSGGGSVTGSGSVGSGTGRGSVTGSGTSGSGTGGGSVTGSGTSGSGSGGGSVTGSGTSGRDSGGGSLTGSGSVGSSTGGGSETGSGSGGTGTENSQSLSGSSSADGNLSSGGTSLPWWLIPLVVSLVLFVVNLILVLFVYNKLKQQIRTNQVGSI